MQIRVGLERQHHHVAQQADMLAEIGGDAGRTLVGGDLCGDVRFLRPLQTTLDLAYAGEVLVQFALVVGAEAALQLTGILHHRVQDAMAIDAAAFDTLFRIAGVAVGEEALEDEARIQLFGDGRGFSAPRDIGGVGAGVAAVAVAGLSAALAADLQRWE